MKESRMYSHLIVESWREYRFWLGQRPRLHVELNLLSGRFNVSVEVEGGGGDDDVMLTLSLVLFSLYVGLSARWLSRVCQWLLRGSYEPRQIGLRIFDWAIWWDCWSNSHSWSSRDPWWMRWTWHPLDTFFGKHIHTDREVYRIETVIPMPEKAYPCVVVMKEGRWRRAYLPWGKTVMRAHIDCKEGVPFPGKGENSWDCGDDAIYSTCAPAKTVEEGIAGYVESVLRNRRRYGGSVNWQKKVAA